MLGKRLHASNKLMEYVGFFDTIQFLIDFRELDNSSKTQVRWRLFLMYNVNSSTEHRWLILWPFYNSQTTQKLVKLFQQVSVANFHSPTREYILTRCPVCNFLFKRSADEQSTSKWGYDWTNWPAVIRKWAVGS